MNKPRQWLNQISVAVTAYSPEGQVIGTWNFAYDPSTLALTNEIIVAGGVTSVLARSQDSFGRVSGFTLGDNYSVSYGFAGDGRFSALTSMVNGLASNSWQYSYLQNSDLIAGVSNIVAGVSSMRAYEPSRDLITSVANRHGATLISSFDYENDAVGRRTLRVDNTATTNLFSYNARSELTGAIMSTNTFSYAFDQIGNRLSASNNVDEWTYLCNALNQYTNITDGVTISPTYDDDGNMTLAPLSSFGGPLLVSTLGWNGENRMISASNTAMVASYSYDYQGRRFQKTVNGTNTTFLYDGWDLVQETSGTNVTQYIWGTDLSGTLQGAGGIGGLLSVIENGVTYYPCFDANGNITDYVDTNGVVVVHREFDPFGNTIVATGDKVNDFHFWFSSKYLDAETGLYYYGYRYYSPGMGRCVGIEPLEELGGLNLYVFIRNGPIDDADYLGLLSIGDIIALIPIIGTIYNAIVDPEGSHIDDYTIDISKEKCCNLGDDAAELACIQGVTLQVAGYEGKYVALTTAHSLVDAIAVLLGKSPVVALVLTADVIVDLLITFNKIEEIGKAGKEAEKKCNCGQFR